MSQKERVSLVRCSVETEDAEIVRKTEEAIQQLGDYGAGFRNARKIAICCMPKSGSTHILTALTRIPGMNLSITYLQTPYHNPDFVEALAAEHEIDELSLLMLEMQILYHEQGALKQRERVLREEKNEATQHALRVAVQGLVGVLPLEAALAKLKKLSPGLVAPAFYEGAAL